HAWKSKKSIFIYPMIGDDLKAYYQAINDTKYYPTLFDLDALPTKEFHTDFFFAQGSIFAFTSELLSEEVSTIFKRFAKVFNQAYTRFLDLQKAEAQAREGQIQLALERVRARAMAMRNSDELNEVIGTVFTECTRLDMILNRSIIMIYDPQTNDSRWWMANPEVPEVPMSFLVKYHEHTPYLAYLDAWKERVFKWEYLLHGSVKKNWDDFIFLETELSLLPGPVIAGMRSMEAIHLNASFNNFGSLTLATAEPLSTEHFDILLRFAKVFDLTYTRFNDLQKAEAQAREGQIEASLERVRSKTMAMHSSHDVGDTIATLFDEFIKLNIETFRCGIGIVHQNKRMEVWTAKRDTNGNVKFFTGYMDMDMHPMLTGAYSGWEQKQETYLYDLKGDDLKEYFTRINNNPNYPLKYDIPSLPYRLIFSVFYFPEGFVFAFTQEELSAEAMKIFKRFSGVFGQTYRRYRDLQKAEAQAKEAQIEAALEKVRSRTLAMQKSDEMAETVTVLFQQLIVLGIEPNRLYIAIVKDEKGASEFWITDEDGTKISTAFSADMNANVSFAKMFEGWKLQRKSLVIEMQGDELQHYFQ
ncbi:MAG: hypothetical protein ABIU77_21935, partial [Ferruginibacter sp.]